MRYETGMAVHKLPYGMEQRSMYGYSNFIYSIIQQGCRFASYGSASFGSKLPREEKAVIM